MSEWLMITRVYFWRYYTYIHVRLLLLAAAANIPRHIEDAADAETNIAGGAARTSKNC